MTRAGPRQLPELAGRVKGSEILPALEDLSRSRSTSTLDCAWATSIPRQTQRYVKRPLLQLLRRWCTAHCHAPVKMKVPAMMKPGCIKAREQRQNQQGAVPIVHVFFF